MILQLQIRKKKGRLQLKCNKCGNEIPIESEFCSYCGNKVEKEEKKTIKLSLKKIIIIEIIVILGIAVVAGICVSVWTRPQISKEETTQNVQNNKMCIYAKKKNTLKFINKY